MLNFRHCEGAKRPKQSKTRLLRRPFGLLAMTAILILTLFLPLASAASLYQDTNRFTYGFKRLVTAPFQIPIRTLQGTLYGPLISGTVGGVFQGAFYTVGDLVGGVFDMGAAAAPYAKYALLV